MTGYTGDIRGFRFGIPVGRKKKIVQDILVAYPAYLPGPALPSDLMFPMTISTGGDRGVALVHQWLKETIYKFSLGILVTGAAIRKL